MYQYISAILLGFISKYLDDREFDLVAKILILFSLVLWYIYLSHFLVIGLAMLLAVYFAGKIDTKTLNIYFLAAIFGLLLALLHDMISLEVNMKFRLLPFLIYLIALYYDEKEIKILGYERILIYIALLGILITALVINILYGDIRLDLYLEDFYGIILFDIGYILAARSMNR